MSGLSPESVFIGSQGATDEACMAAIDGAVLVLVMKPMLAYHRQALHCPFIGSHPQLEPL